MAAINPFPALRYDLAKAGTAQTLVCPPYDVIDAALQETLYARNPHNIVRVEFGKTAPTDAPGNDRYSRAAETLAKWKAEGVLKRDARPAFYVYEQTFDLGAGGAAQKKIVSRRGFFGALTLEPFGTGSVFPHEETFGGPKADRLALMRACTANLSPVFGLVPDDDGALSNLLRRATSGCSPDLDFADDGGVRNKLWVVNDAATCGALRNCVSRRNVFIADGHHRYETCCNYRDEIHPRADKSSAACDATLMMCVPMSDPGLCILPTHRMVQRQPGQDKDMFLREASGLFSIHESDAKQLLALAQEQRGAIRFGVIFNDGSHYILAETPAGVEAMQSAAPRKSKEWRSLDVAVLQELLLKGVLRLSEEKVLKKEGILYTPDAKQVLAQVPGENSDCLLGFILRPTRIEQVRAVSLAGEKMPQKSTYFYPKLLSGLVLREL